MDTTKKKSTGKETDPDKYPGKKDEYGGTMTGTGYGQQAKKGKKPDADDKKYPADDDPDTQFEQNQESKGFDEGQGQGSGYGRKQSGR